jgi:small subunit ribosomal protein S6
MSDTATETPEAETEAPSSPENRVLQKGKLARHLTHERVLPQLSPEIEGKTRLYELCLLFDPAEATRTWDALVEWIKTELIETKYGQHVLRVDKWADTRKLAYEIQGLKRGTYMVVWLRSAPGVIADLERDLRLDERCVRHLIISHDFEPPGVGKTAEDFDQKHEEERGERERERGERGDRGGGGGRRDRRF